MLLQPQPQPNKALARAFLPTAKDRIEALNWPASGYRRPQFEALVFDWQPETPEVESLDHDSRQYAVDKLDEQGVITPVDSFPGGERIFPGSIRQGVAKAKWNNEAGQLAAKLNRAFRAMDDNMREIFLFLDIRSAGRDQADINEANRVIRRQIAAMETRCARMVKDGVTIADMQQYLRGAYDLAARQRWAMALPWLDEDSGLTEDDVWPDTPKAVRIKLSPHDRAKAAIQASGRRGMTRTELRKLVSSNNAFDMTGFLRDLLNDGVIEMEVPRAPKAPGRPTTRFYISGSKPQSLEEIQAEIQRHMNDPFSMTYETTEDMADDDADESPAGNFFEDPYN